MSNVKEQVQAFLNKCEELKNCKFIMATTKIKDLLKCIVNSSELYLLFKEVTQNFDYNEFKKRCLITAHDGYVNKSYVSLPDAAGDRLAFIFCLLVEFDRDSINFNSFLQRYYAEDGSYYSSYHAFCDDVICNLQTLIQSVFELELADGNMQQQNYSNQNESNAYLASVLTQIDFLLRREIEQINAIQIQDEEKEAGVNILNELYKAIKQANVNLIDALLNGYHYFCAQNKIQTDSFKELVNTISNLLGALCD